MRDARQDNQDVGQDDVYFYHTMDIPGRGHVQGEWTLRDVEHSYLGGVALAGKSVLEIGPASGFLTMRMEQGGADVVAFDLDEAHMPDNLVASPDTCNHYVADFRRFQRRLNNGFGEVHRAFGLKAGVRHGTVYDLPADLGIFDMATFCSVLLHLRDPFLALYRVSRHVRDTLVVTDMLPLGTRSLRARLGRFLIERCLYREAGGEVPAMGFFLPAGGAVKHQFAWWLFPPETISRFLAILGFETRRVVLHEQEFQGRMMRLYTVVAERVGDGQRLLV